MLEFESALSNEAVVGVASEAFAGRLHNRYAP